MCEQIDLNLLFRWFLDMQPSDEAFDATTFTKNRQRLDDHGLTQAFFDAVVAEALTQGLCSEHFSVDGTLIESLASAKSFQPKEATDEEPEDGQRLQAPQSRGRFPRPEADERDAPQPNRSRGEAVPQGAGKGGEAVAHGPRARPRTGTA